MDLQLQDYRALVTGSSGGIGEGIAKTLANEGVAAKTKGWGDDWNEIERNVVKELLPNPTGRVGRIEEVASLVALVASPECGFINGANLRVDGCYVVSVN